MKSSLVVAILFLALGCACGDDVTAHVEKAVVEEKTAAAVAVSQAEPKAKAKDNGGWVQVLSCFLKDNANDCFEQQTYKVMKNWIDSARKTKSQGGLLKTKGKPEGDKGIMDHLGDIFTFGVSRFLSFVESDEDDDEEGDAKEADGETDLLEEEFGRGLQEGRKKKKGKLKKLIAVIKLIVLFAVAKAKITLILDKLGFLLKLKFFVVAFLHLLIALAKLWFEWSKHKTPQKVIYYEHAQHQHHYDNEHHHDDGGWFGGGGSGEKKGGWLGGLWSRSTDEPEKKISVQAPQETSHNVYYPQDAAYSAYRPQEYSQQYPAYRQ